MSIGDRIRDKALKAAGTEIEILRGDTMIPLTPTEYITTSISNQATKPFIRENYLSADFAYSTQAVPGDMIVTKLTGLGADNATYIVMNITDEPFRNTVITKNAVLYKTQITATIQYEEYSTTTTGKKVKNWVTRYTDIPTLITDTRFGNGLSDHEGIGEISVTTIIGYISGYFEVNELDRLVLSTGEVMKVTAVAKYQFKNALELTLEQDTRA